MKPNRLYKITTVLLLVLLGACTSVPLTTMWKLRNFDPLQADPSSIQIAVITDQIVQLEDDAVSLEISFRSDQSEYNFSSVSNATVKPNSLINELNKHVAQHQRISLFYLDDDAAHKMRLSQNRIQ